MPKRSRGYRIYSILCSVGFLLALCSCSGPSSSKDGSVHVLSETAIVNRASDLNIQLGMAYLREDRFDLAQSKFMRAVELDPTSAKAHYSLGYYYEKVGEVLRAKEFYAQAFQMAPQDPAVQNSYGVFLCRQGHYDEGQALLLKAAKDSQFVHVGLAYENAGFCAVSAGRAEESLIYFKNAVAHNPRLVNSYYQLAHISFKLQRYQEANVYLEKYAARANQTTESLELGIKLAEHFEQEDKLAVLKARLDENRL